MAVAAAESARHAGARPADSKATIWSSRRTAGRSISSTTFRFCGSFGGNSDQHAHLFTPHPVVRSVDRAGIDYFLAKEADSVKIDILDAKGKVVRSFVGSPGGGKEAEARRGARTKVEAVAGRGSSSGAQGRRQSLHLGSPLPRRDNVRRPDLVGRAARSGPDRGARQLSGPVDGERRHGDAAVDRVADPREIHITQADLEEQFKLAIQVRDKTSEANDMVIRIREMKKQIDDRVKKDSVAERGGRAPVHQSERGGRGRLPGPQPQRPGPAEFPDQDQQPVGR